ncbi:MAG: hypothetical protein ABSF22_23585 [Bryobacteraceae bacterium]
MNDFPTTITNSTLAINGVWSYGWLAAGTQTPFGLDLAAPNYFGDGNASGFSEFGGTSLPTILKNTTGSTIPVEGGTIGPWPANLLLLHPGPNGDVSVVQFTAPTAGSYSVSGEFLAMGNTITNPSTPGQTTDTVVVAGTTVTTIYSSNTAQPFSFTTSLTAGQTIDFEVGLGPAGQFSFDSTGFNAAITSATPEPGFYGVLALGLTGLAAAARRLKRA